MIGKKNSPKILDQGALVKISDKSIHFQLPPRLRHEVNSAYAELTIFTKSVLRKSRI